MQNNYNPISLINNDLYSTNFENINKFIIQNIHVINNRIVRSAVYNKSNKVVCWIGLAADIKYRNVNIAPVGMYLYDGLSGIILYLAYCGIIFKDNIYSKMAEFALTTLNHQILRNQSQQNKIGAFDGWGGIIYLYSHLIKIWKDNSFKKKSIKIILFNANNIEKSFTYDIISGLSGYSLCLLSLFYSTEDNMILEFAIKCGNKLVHYLDHIIKNKIFFINNNPVKSGFAHGLSGMIYALLRLFEITSINTFKDTALKTLKYEKLFYSKEHKNWYTEKNRTEIPSVKWCYGAVGIGLTRFKAFNLFKNSEIRDELNTAFNTTIKKGFGNNHCLCHGDFGNFEFILQMLSSDSDNDLLKKNILIKILYSLKKDNYIGDIAYGVETPGLMMGLSGMGYELLRILNYDIVPSVLTLDPPFTYVES